MKIGSIPRPHGALLSIFISLIVGAKIFKNI